MEEPYIYVCSDCGAEAIFTGEKVWRHKPEEFSKNPAYLMCINYGYQLAVRKKYRPEVVVDKLDR